MAMQTAHANHRLDRIERDYQTALAGTPEKPRGKPGRPSANQQAEIATILKSMDNRGAWVDKGKLKSDSSPVEDGVITSERFIANVTALCRYVAATK